MICLLIGTKIGISEVLSTHVFFVQYIKSTRLLLLVFRKKIAKEYAYFDRQKMYNVHIIPIWCNILLSCNSHLFYSIWPKNSDISWISLFCFKYLALFLYAGILSGTGDSTGDDAFSSTVIRSAEHGRSPNGEVGLGWCFKR